MPDEKTRSDSIRMYYSGATSDGGAQSDPDAALGNYRSSTEETHLGQQITNPISNVTVDFVSAANGTGAGSMAATGVDDLAWTPPGGSQGAAVTILNGETKILEGGGGESIKFIRVTRTSATALTGTATVTLSDQFNNLVSLDNVASAEASAGDVEHRAMFLKNEAVSTVNNLKVYVGKIGTSRVSAAGQLGASGSGTISISAGNFNDWPSSGFCRIEDSGGTLKEIVYYTSRTSTALTVPAAGRGLLGTTATAGAATDNIHSVPGIRLAMEAPSAQPAGFIQTIANEDTAPTGLTWVTGITAATGLNIGNLASGNIYGLWIERTVIAGATSDAAMLHKFTCDYEAA